MLGYCYVIPVVKMHIFFLNCLIYSRTNISQTKSTLTITKIGSTKIVNFMTPGAGVPVLGRDHIGVILKMHLFFKILL